MLTHKKKLFLIDVGAEPEKCLLEEAMKREMEKPQHLRQKGIAIVCQCQKCKKGL